MSVNQNVGFISIRPRLKPVILILVLFIAVIFIMLNSSRALATPTTYYVDCAGSDQNNGSSPSLAWQSLDKANTAVLLPGDSLLFKRGCTWQGTLRASWNGTASQPILIGAYDLGALPKIQNSPTDLSDSNHNNVDITGSYLIIEYIETTIVNPPVDPGCQNNPIGFFIGFNFRNPDELPNGGSFNVLRYSKASWQTAGVHLQDNTHHNQILFNEFTNNNVMQTLTPISQGANDDIGAWGILLKGSNHRVARNYFSQNNAICTYDTNPQGNSVELYEAQNNLIHYNTSVNDRIFSELGSSAAIKSKSNTFAFNVVASSVLDARFITTRGTGSSFGPVYDTRLFHNTVYYTGSQSQGVVCGAGCNANMLTARNNIFWAEEKAAFADGAFNESNNIYWSSSGAPVIQYMGFGISPSSLIANPMFVNPSGNDFHLSPLSPAIDAGMLYCWQQDIDGLNVPQGGGNDIGSYEYLRSPSNPNKPCSMLLSFLPFLHK